MKRIISFILMLYIVCGIANAATITVCSSGCDETILTTALSSAASGDTVSVEDGGPYNLTNYTYPDGVTLINNSGGICRLTSTLGARHFSFASNSSENTRIIGFTFDNTAGTTTGSGGSISVTGSFNGTIEDCVFDTNLASADGGALYFSPGIGTLAGYLINCTFTDNDAGSEGGAIYIIASNEISLAIVECDFEGNNADDFGGAIHISLSGGGDVDMDINTCTFTDNSTEDDDGGAVSIVCASGSNLNDLDFTSCIFTNNKCGTIGDGTNGGAIAIIPQGTSVIDITSCDFEGNEACSNATDPHGNGGAIYFGGSVIFTCTSTDFTANIANSITGGASTGGAICSFIGNSLITISDCTFTNNIVSISANTDPAQGGALALTGNSNSSITGCTFIGNSISGTLESPRYQSGGAIATNGFQGIISNNIFTSNTAGWGGAVHLWAGVGAQPSSFTNNTFSNNKAISNLSGNDIDETYDAGCGGSILLDHNSVTMDHCTFDADTAYCGGSIYAWHVTVATISNCTFTNCHADSVGGAIVTGGSGGSGGKLRVVDCAMTNCTATDFGGGIGHQYAGATRDMVVMNSFITGCQTDGDGGGIYQLYSEETDSLYNVSIINCIAGNDGGGLYVANDQGFIYDSLIDGNTSTGDGGGIFYADAFASAADSAAIINTKIVNNTANAGGGIYIATGQMDMQNVLLAGNTCSVGGAGISQLLTHVSATKYSSDWSYLTVVNNTGAGIMLHNPGLSELVVNLTNSVFDGNTEGGYEVTGTGQTATLNCINSYNNTYTSTDNYTWDNGGIGHVVGNTYYIMNEGIPTLTVVINASGEANFTTEAGLLEAGSIGAGVINASNDSFSLNPLFKERTNYFLRSASPCLSRNYPSGASCGDYIGYTDNIGSSGIIGSYRGVIINDIIK